jgi:hypothetical protein
MYTGEFGVFGSHAAPGRMNLLGRHDGLQWVPQNVLMNKFCVQLRNQITAVDLAPEAAEQPFDKTKCFVVRCPQISLQLLRKQQHVEQHQADDRVV